MRNLAERAAIDAQNRAFEAEEWFRDRMDDASSETGKLVTGKNILLAFGATMFLGISGAGASVEGQDRSAVEVFRDGIEVIVRGIENTNDFQQGVRDAQPVQTEPIVLDDGASPPILPIPGQEALGE